MWRAYRLRKDPTREHGMFPTRQVWSSQRGTPPVCAPDLPVQPVRRGSRGWEIGSHSGSLCRIPYFGACNGSGGPPPRSANRDGPATPLLRVVMSAAPPLSTAHPMGWLPCHAAHPMGGHNVPIVCGLADCLSQQHPLCRQYRPCQPLVSSWTETVLQRTRQTARVLSDHNRAGLPPLVAHLAPLSSPAHHQRISR